jgi:hypothetical protein
LEGGGDAMDRAFPNPLFFLNIGFEENDLEKVFLFVANTFQIQPFHKGLAMQADVAFGFMPGAQH